MPQCNVAPRAQQVREGIASPPHAVDEVAFPNHLDDFGVRLRILPRRFVPPPCMPFTCLRPSGRPSGRSATGLSSRNPPCSIAFFTVIERVYQSRYLREYARVQPAAALAYCSL